VLPWAERKKDVSNICLKHAKKEKQCYAAQKKKNKTQRRKK
jgi:hypothetical protein